MSNALDPFLLALQYYQNGELAAASDLCHQVLDAQPNHADAWHLLGVVAHQVGRHEKAKELMRQAVTLNPTNAAYHSNLGALYAACGDREEAGRCYRRALELRPDLAEAHNNLANILRDQGQRGEAARHYQKALQLKPDYADACNGLGTILKEEGKLEEAVACFRKALQLKPGSKVARSNLDAALQDLTASATKLQAEPACRQNMREIIDRFHTMYYDSNLVKDIKWMGFTCWKNPLDLWVYHEIIWETRPDLIIECGTAYGGSALYMAHMMDILSHGSIVSIDVANAEPRPRHPRIQYLLGCSSIDGSVVAQVANLAASSKSTMVILDSDHNKNHVLAEMRTYCPLVTTGNYLIVEDTNVNGHPVYPEHGAGPWEAVQEFLTENDDFVVDCSREKLMLTFNPGGFLRRVKTEIA